MEIFWERQLQILEQGQVYEFAQNVENRAKRHLAKKEYSECQHLALSGLLQLLRKKSNTSLLELQDLLVKSSVSAPNYEMIEEVFMLLPSGDGVELMKKIVKNCNDPNIYSLLARTMEDQENIPKALLYWVGSDDFKDLYRTLQILIDRGYPGEQDLFVCRTTLMLLAFKKTGMAKHLLAEFKYIESPLINFTKFLVQALECSEKTLVAILREKYAKWINRDPKLVKYIQQVEKVYFSDGSQNSLVS